MSSRAGHVAKVFAVTGLTDAAFVVVVVVSVWSGPYRISLVHLARPEFILPAPRRCRRRRPPRRLYLYCREG